MSLTAEITELCERCDESIRLCKSGYVDEWFFETFHASRLKQFKPVENEMYRTYFYSFAKRRMVNLVRAVFLEAKVVLNDRHVLTGKSNPDLVHALAIIDEYLGSLPNYKTESWKTRFLKIAPFSGAAMTFIINQDPTLVFLVGGLIAIGFVIPTGMGLLFSNLVNAGMEQFWINRCIKQLGVRALQKRIINDARNR